MKKKKKLRQNSFQCFSNCCFVFSWCVRFYFVRNYLLWMIPVFWLINKENTCLSASYSSPPHPTPSHLHYPWNWPSLSHSLFCHSFILLFFHLFLLSLLLLLFIFIFQQCFGYRVSSQFFNNNNNKSQISDQGESLDSPRLSQIIQLMNMMNLWFPPLFVFHRMYR